MKSSIFILIIVLIGSAAYTSIRNTWKWASDFNGLVVLVSVPDKERSINPYSKNFFWVSQNLALHILKTQSYPYENCSLISIKMSGCEQARIEYVGRFVGMVDEETELKIFELIGYLIEKNEPVNAYSSDGYTALQAAILWNSPKLVSLLFESGADPYLPIKNGGSIDGKSSVEFIELLFSKDPENYASLMDVFNQKMSSKQIQKDSPDSSPIL